MFGTSWRVGRIAGVEVRVDSSWVVIALLITYSMHLQVADPPGPGPYGPSRRPGRGDPDAWMDGVLGKLQDGTAGRVLIAQDGEVVGIITPSDLTRWLRRWRTLEGSAH